ncbi:potassium channel, putative [Plasmodium gallinaceum]|uniref:Potassium channel, putative n=1 Tax=Plasmodium gallinaceum TaxID=5849 RepID=A0A1J1GRF1_PLAGA|nr:potassium channel, putative [Plasmodium gallinaceum]CRG94852.1 potassium channel, putative [Plasmodium gallinaceum]
MKNGLFSLKDLFFLVKSIFKYFLIFLNGLYLIKLLKSSKENINFTNGITCLIIGFIIKIVLIAINCIYFMNIYQLKKIKKRNFLNLFNFTKISRNINSITIEYDDFEYKKLIKKFFFKKIFYSIKKKHKIVELYMLKIYNSTFNYYFCNIKDTLYTIIWFISLYFWRRNSYDIMWNFNKIPPYIFNILFILLSTSYVDLIIIILSYNKSKYSVMKSKLLIDVFFSAPSAFFFSKHFFFFENQIDIYFMMGFLRNVKIFLNVSYVRIEHNSILTNTEIKIIRIVLGVLLLCNAFASTIYTIQAIHPYNLKNGNFNYFLNSYLDYFYFSIISISTVGYGDIFPNNKLSKVVCIFFIFWTFIWVPIQFNDLIISIFSKKKSYGKISLNNQKFILLIGDIEPQQLNVFLFESFAYGNKLKFHLLTSYPINFYKDQIKLADYFCIPLYIQNSDLNEKENTNLLSTINAHNAYYLFLFSSKLYNSQYNVDTKSFARLLILKKFLLGKKNAVIELRNNCMSNIIKSIGYENFVIVNLKYSLIVKNIKYPGFITLILNLFTAYNFDIYSYKIDNLNYFPSLKYKYEFTRGSRTKIFSFSVHKNMVGLKYDKLFYKLYESLGIILLGIETDNPISFKSKYRKKSFFIDNLFKIIKKKKKNSFKFIHLHLLKKYIQPFNYMNKENQQNNNNQSNSNNNNMKNINKKKSTIEKCNLPLTKDANISKQKMFIGYNDNVRNYEYSSNNESSSKKYENVVNDNSLTHNNNFSIKNSYSNNNTNLSNVCINIINNSSHNNLKKTYQKKGGKYFENTEQCDYKLCNRKKSSLSTDQNNKNKSSRKLKCYLNLLGKSYFMKKSDKCIVIADSRKVIKYLSKAKDLFWLFEIKSKKKNKISYDLKSIIKTKQSFNKYFTKDIKKNMATKSLEKKIGIKEYENIIAINYHELFNNYRISKFFTKKSYDYKKKCKLLLFEDRKKNEEKNLKLLHSINKYEKDNSDCDYNTTYDNDIFNCINYSNLIAYECDNTDKNVKKKNNLYDGYNFENKTKKKKKEKSFRTNNDTEILHTSYTQLSQNETNYFNHKRKLKKKSYLNKYCNFKEVENFKESNKKKFDYTLKNPVVYSYAEAYEKYFQKNNNKLLLIINCTSNIIHLIKMINNKYKYNIIMLTDEMPPINIFDLYKYNVVFIKFKYLDDYNLINAGLIQANYILIFPTKINDINDINEIDMNTIILTRKVTQLLKKIKKTHYINNIITELINPSNIIFLEENKMIKLIDKKSPYCDFFPYVNSSQFYSSNIICETMLYNFMTHHKSFSKFSVCNDTLESLIKYISIIYICDLNKYFDFSFKRIKTFRDIFYFLSKRNITIIGLYRRGDKNIPFYIYTKPNENCLLRFDDIIYVL